MDSSVPPDPWDWSIDHVVQVFCRCNEIWDDISANPVLPDRHMLEQAIRNSGINGQTLLKRVNDDVLNVSMGITVLGQRSTILEAIERLQRRSKRYQDQSLPAHMQAFHHGLLRSQSAAGLYPPGPSSYFQPPPHLMPGFNSSQYGPSHNFFPQTGAATSHAVYNPTGNEHLLGQETPTTLQTNGLDEDRGTIASDEGAAFDDDTENLRMRRSRSRSKGQDSSRFEATGRKACGHQPRMALSSEKSAKQTRSGGDGEHNAPSLDSDPQGHAAKERIAPATPKKSSGHRQHETFVINQHGTKRRKLAPTAVTVSDYSEEETTMNGIHFQGV